MMWEELMTNFVTACLASAGVEPTLWEETAAGMEN